MLGMIAEKFNEGVALLTQGTAGLEAYRVGVSKDRYQQLLSDLNERGYGLNISWEPERIRARNLIRVGAEIINFETSAIPRLTSEPREQEQLRKAFREVFIKLAYHLQDNLSGQHIDVLGSAFEAVSVRDIFCLLPQAIELIVSAYPASTTAVELDRFLEQVIRIDLLDQRGVGRQTLEYYGEKPFLPEELQSKHIKVNNVNLTLIADSLEVRKSQESRNSFVGSLLNYFQNNDCFFGSYRREARAFTDIIAVVNSSLKSDESKELVSRINSNPIYKQELGTKAGDFLTLIANPRLTRLWYGYENMLSDEGQRGDELKPSSRSVVLNQIASQLDKFRDDEIQVIAKKRIIPIAKFLEKCEIEVTDKSITPYLEYAEQLDALIKSPRRGRESHIDILIKTLDKQASLESIAAIVNGVNSLLPGSRESVFYDLIIPHLTNNPDSHSQENIQKMIFVINGVVDQRWDDDQDVSTMTEGLSDLLPYISDDPEASKLKALLDIIVADRPVESCQVISFIIRPAVLGLLGHVIAPPQEQGILSFRSFDSYTDRELAVKSSPLGEYQSASYYSEQEASRRYGLSSRKRSFNGRTYYRPPYNTVQAIHKLKGAAPQIKLDKNYIEGLGRMAWGYYSNLTSDDLLNSRYWGEELRRVFTELAFIDNGLSLDILANILNTNSHKNSATASTIAAASFAYDLQQLKLDSAEGVAAFCQTFNTCSPESAEQLFQTKAFKDHARKVDGALLSGIQREVEGLDPNRVAVFVSLGFGGMLSEPLNNLDPDLVQAYGVELKAISSQFASSEEFNQVLKGFYNSMNGHFTLTELQKCRGILDGLNTGDAFTKALVGLMKRIDSYDYIEDKYLLEYAPIVERTFREPTERDKQVALRERQKRVKALESFDFSLLPVVSAWTFINESMKFHEDLYKPCMSCLAKAFYGKEMEITPEAIQGFSRELVELTKAFPKKEDLQKAIQALIRVGVNQENIEAMNKKALNA